ncbi:MAG: hypothetical protein H6836_05425 [Planctomycetes bacterium]|nr:hypothetical protein [Planctomycetota bacterium]
MIHVGPRSRRGRLFAGAMLAGIVLAPLGAQRASTQAPLPRVAIPNALIEVVLGGRKQPQVEVVLGGLTLRSLSNLGGKPILAWPTGAKPVALPKNQAAVLAWLARSATALATPDLRARFLSIRDWRGTEVWDYEMSLAGRAVLDARVSVYWNPDGSLLGLSSTLIAPNLGIDAAPDRIGADEVWFAEARRGGYRWVLAQLRTQSTSTRSITQVMCGTRLVNTIHTVRVTTPPPSTANATITEIPVPAGTFPDQIFADSTGLIWFSQPNNNQVTSYDPKAQKFTQYPAPTGVTGPDGLMVDDRDRVWTGMYYSGQLSMLDIPTKTYTQFPVPYSPSNPAIPVASGHDTIWVTDHIANRISELDPKAGKWLGSYVMPTVSCWVTAGALDPVHDDMYFTEYYGHALGHKALGKPVVDIPDPNRGGPAFLAHHDGKVYYSLWSQARLAAYDVVGKTVTTFNFPQTAEYAGPMAIAPNGDVIVGTRSSGYIEVFNPTTKTFTAYKIPTNSAGLKDGLTVAPDGTVWFTESGQNKIAMLKLP